MYTIVFDQISEKAYEYAEKNLEKVIRWDSITDEDLMNAEAAIVRVHKMDKTTIDSMPNLKIIAKHGVGTDNIDKDYAREKDIVVTNTPNANANSVAELVLALSLALARKIVCSHKEVDRGVERISPPELTGFEINGKTLGLIGLGHIGARVSHMFKQGFDTNVLVYDPFITKESCRKLDIVKVEDLNYLLEKSDIISISVPLTIETENMIAERELKIMKNSAILINTSRGKIVNEEDLYKALQDGQIYGAAMDAFAVEPVSKDLNLLQCDNFIATPHNGANTSDALIKMGYGAVDEIKRLSNNEENINVVNRR